MHRRYEITLGWALRHSCIMLMLIVLTVVTNGYLFWIIPKGFFPEQDTGRIGGSIQAEQDISFQAMKEKMAAAVDILMSDPEVQDVSGYTGTGSGTNVAGLFLSLKPFEERKASVRQVINRLRPKLMALPGAPTVLQPVQELRIGGRQSRALYQYTLMSTDLAQLMAWAPRMTAKVRTLPQCVDVSSDQQNRGLQANLVIDRPTASRLGITPQLIDNTLYDAFGQNQVSITYTQLNQYHVVMEVAPPFWQRPETLRDIYVRPPNGPMVPLERIHPLRANPYVALRKSPGTVPGGDHFVQSRSRVCPRGCGKSDREGQARDGNAGYDTRAVHGHGSGLRGRSGQRTAPHPFCAPGGLHRSRHPL